MHVDDFIPGAGADFLIDAAVGKHFDAVLQKRDEDQDSRVIARVVQALIGKRRECESMNRLADTVFGREYSFHRWEPGEKKSDQRADDRPKLKVGRSPRIAPEPLR